MKYKSKTKTMSTQKLWLVVFSVCSLYQLLQAGATNHCEDHNGRSVRQGELFYPTKLDVCLECVCQDGQAVQCRSVLCSPPACGFYETVKNECCKFECIALPGPEGPNGTKSQNTVLTIPDTTSHSLRLIISCATSFIFFAIILLMIHRLRKRRMLLIMRRLRMDGQDDIAEYMPQDSAVELPSYNDPPPPYSPPKPDMCYVLSPPPYSEVIGGSVVGEDLLNVSQVNDNGDKFTSLEVGQDGCHQGPESEQSSEVPQSSSRLYTEYLPENELACSSTQAWSHDQPQPSNDPPKVKGRKKRSNATSLTAGRKTSSASKSSTSDSEHRHSTA